MRAGEAGEGGRDGGGRLVGHPGAAPDDARALARPAPCQHLRASTSLGLVCHCLAGLQAARHHAEQSTLPAAAMEAYRIVRIQVVDGGDGPNGAVHPLQGPRGDGRVQQRARHREEQLGILCPARQGAQSSDVVRRALSMPRSLENRPSCRAAAPNCEPRHSAALMHVVRARARTSSRVWLSRCEMNSQTRVQWPGGVCEPVGSAQYSTTTFVLSFSAAESASSSLACRSLHFV